MDSWGAALEKLDKVYRDNFMYILGVLEVSIFRLFWYDKCWPTFFLDVRRSEVQVHKIVQ